MNRSRGFTLIELLVVVAIIALLISILLPSLNKARAQARTTLCLSRVGQFGKSFFLYAEDYGGVFPFLSTLQESYEQGPNTIENWLCNWGEHGSDEARTAIRTVAYHPETEWGAMRDALPRSGLLYTYARFDALYRCPEFERQKQAEQLAFNYTRPIWGRLYRLPDEYTQAGLTPPFELWGGVDGPVMRMDQIYSPGKLPLLLDEQWNRFVGSSTEGLPDYNGSAYNASEYGFWTDNNIAVVHGAPVRSTIHPYDSGPESLGTAFGKDPFVWGRGGLVYYDGHAELQRDPWPTLGSGNNTRTGPFRAQSEGIARQCDEYNAMQCYCTAMLFMQRGLDPIDRWGHPPNPW